VQVLWSRVEVKEALILIVDFDDWLILNYSGQRRRRRKNRTYDCPQWNAGLCRVWIHSGQDTEVQVSWSFPIEFQDLEFFSQKSIRLSCFRQWQAMGCRSLYRCDTISWNMSKDVGTNNVTFTSELSKTNFCAADTFNKRERRVDQITYWAVQNVFNTHYTNYSNSNLIIWLCWSRRMVDVKQKLMFEFEMN